MIFLPEGPTNSSSLVSEKWMLVNAAYEFSQTPSFNRPDPKFAAVDIGNGWFQKTPLEYSLLLMVGQLIH